MALTRKLCDCVEVSPLLEQKSPYLRLEEDGLIDILHITFKFYEYVDLSFCHLLTHFGPLFNIKAMLPLGIIF